MSASSPAISTPVGPPPTTTNVSHSLARGGVVAALGFLEGAVDALAQAHGVVERLQAVGHVLPLVVPEVGGLRAAGHDQAVVVEALSRSSSTS